VGSSRRGTIVLARQKVLISILQEAGGQASRVQLMKWAFLLGMETLSQGGSSYYHFVPYLYGPHSFSLYQEIDALLRDGVLEVQKESLKWKLQDSFQKEILLPTSLKTDLRYIMNKYGSMKNSQLIDIIYDRYPWFTINCQDLNKQQSSRPVAEPAVYTIGYEGLSVDDFLNRLMKNGIQCILDVRNNPISRRYGFHKSTLSRLCELLDLEYLHFPELGIPSAARERLSTKDDYEKLFHDYRKSTLPDQSRTLKSVASILRSCPSVLVCMEADPDYCHRKSLAESLSLITELSIKHLEWPR